jgi:hypothetical protein
MRYFPIPKAIRVLNRKPGPGRPPQEDLSFVSYANVVWFDDARWQMPKRNMAALVQIVREFDKPEGEMACCEDTGWAILKDIIENPSMGERGPNLLLPLIQIQVGPTFEGAVLGATPKDPREVIAPVPSTADAPTNGTASAS